MRRDPIARQLPGDLYIESTNRCNSRCQTCIRTFEQLEPRRDMTLDEFQMIVDQFPSLQRVVLHGIGEPLLNAELVPMIRYLRQRHPAAQVLFNSNAILLDEQWQNALLDAGLDEYRVSVDAATPETYARIRGVDGFDVVMANVRRFARLLCGRQRPRLSFWMMAMRENLDELPDLVDLAAEIGVPEVYVQRLVLIDRGLARGEQSLHGQLRAREQAVLAQAAARARTHQLAFRASGLTSPRESLQRQERATGAVDPVRVGQDGPYSACHRLWTTTYITANGNVLPCCISPFSTNDYAGLILGNVFHSPLAEIWNGDRYIARRAALYTAHPLPPCGRCGVDWAL